MGPLKVAEGPEVKRRRDSSPPAGRQRRFVSERTEKIAPEAFRISSHRKKPGWLEKTASRRRLHALGTSRQAVISAQAQVKV
jgi:hypothetical protein